MTPMPNSTIADPAVTFEAAIVPHRSLSARGLRVLAAGLVLPSAGISLGLWLVGAWPVIGFTGLEAALAIWLVRRHALGARGSELLVLSDEGLHVVRVNAGGARSEHLVPPGWIRADLEERPGRTPALLVRSRGQDVEVAAALGEAEKRSLATALQEALRRQRAPVFDNPQLRDD